MKHLLRKGLPLIFLLVLAPNIALAGGGTATPAGGDPFTNVTTALCGVANAMQGPVGIAVGILVLVAGLIAMQVANRDAIPMISRAVIGTALLIGATTAFTALIVAPGC